MFIYLFIRSYWHLPYYRQALTRLPGACEAAVLESEHE
jgi:hypothetical protein